MLFKFLVQRHILVRSLDSNKQPTKEQKRLQEEFLEMAKNDEIVDSQADFNALEDEAKEIISGFGSIEGIAAADEFAKELEAQEAFEAENGEE